MEIVQVLPLLVGIVVVVAAVIAAAVSPYRWNAALFVAVGGATVLLGIAWLTQTQMGVCAETMVCFLNKATNRCAPGPCELQAQHLRHVAWVGHRRLGHGAVRYLLGRHTPPVPAPPSV